MALTETQQAFVDALRESVRLKDPASESDSAYKYEDTELWDIITDVVPVHNSQYTSDTIPENEKFLALILARKEIFWRLATSTAPYYPISAEGASLQKNVRFDHYYALISLAMSEYGLAKSSFNSSGVVESKDVTIQAYHNSVRNYNLANKPTVSITTSEVTATTVKVDWTKFSADRGLFYSYKLFATKTPLIDEYADIPIKEGVHPEFFTGDINRLKYRVEKLDPSTQYYITILSIDRNGLYGYAQSIITTLPSS